MSSRTCSPCALVALLGLSIPIFAQNPIRTVPGRAFSVAGLGDIDLDGTPDFILGIPDAPQAGSARVCSGRTGLPLFTISGDVSGDQAGYALSPAGDVDGDGHPDFAVALNASDIGSLNAGVVRVYSGATGAQLRQYVGANSFANFGTSVALAGDVDGDGRADLVVGSPYENQSGIRGSARIYSGADGSLIRVVFGANVDDVFGCSVAGAGDLDGDGHADIVVGANQSTNLNAPGYAQVFSGATGAVLFTYHGDSNGDQFGSCVAGGGDVNGDGLPDIAVSAPQAHFGSALGMVRTFSGVDGSVLHTIRSVGFFGSSLAMLGDLNLDGAADYAAGETHAYGGRVVVVSGRTGKVLYRLSSSGTTDQFGHCVARMDDFTGDGIPDVIVGAPSGSLFGFGAGYVTLYTGLNRRPTTYCTATINSLGCTPTVSSYGVPSAGGDDNFRIEATQVLNNAPGFLIFGAAPASIPLFGGTLCVQGSLVRSAIQLSGGSATGDDCTGGLSLAITQAYLHAHGWSGGNVVYAQWWSRDRGFVAPNNVSLTDGLAFEVAP